MRGPAKVAVVSSGLMGALSGSVVTNVMTTGIMTIPAMKGITAAPIETGASTGGYLCLRHGDRSRCHG